MKWQDKKPTCPKGRDNKFTWRLLVGNKGRCGWIGWKNGKHVPYYESYSLQYIIERGNKDE